MRTTFRSVATRAAFGLLWVLAERLGYRRRATPRCVYALRSVYILCVRVRFSLPTHTLARVHAYTTRVRSHARTHCGTPSLAIEQHGRSTAFSFGRRPSGRVLRIGPTSAPGLAPHLHRDWPHICTGTPLFVLHAATASPDVSSSSRGVKHRALTWHGIPHSMVSCTARYLTWHGYPPGTVPRPGSVSHTAWYPTQHGNPAQHGMSSRTAVSHAAWFGVCRS